MLISFFDANGIVHKEFVPSGQTVNQQVYLEVLERLHGSVWRKRPEMWTSGGWFLHHDNAPAHMALSVQQFLSKSTWWLSLILRIHLTLHHAIFSSSLVWNANWKGNVLLMSAKWKTKCWRSGTKSALKSSRNVFSSGKNVGTSISSQKESTLREIRVIMV